ncbi:MAG: GH109, partial [uncultured Frankineae bacterium]
ERRPALGHHRHWVHRRCARPSGARRGRNAHRCGRLLARDSGARPGAAQSRAGRLLGPGADRVRRRRRGARLHAQPPARAAGRAGARRRQARGVREAARHDARRGPAPGRPRRQGGRRHRRAVRVPLLPDGAGGPGPHPGGRARPAVAAARLVPAGLARRRGREQLAGRPGARRRLPRLRRHRRALVRPHGVRHRTPDHLVDSRPRLGLRPAPRAGRCGTSGHGGRRSAALPHRPGRDRVARREPGLARTQEPALVLLRRHVGVVLLRPGAARLAVGRRQARQHHGPPEPRAAVRGSGRVRHAARRSPPGVPGQLQRLRRRHLRSHHRPRPGGLADVLRRPARRADHRCSPRVRTVPLLGGGPHM